MRGPPRRVARRTPRRRRSPPRATLARRATGDGAGRDEILHDADEEEGMALGAPIKDGGERCRKGVVRKARSEIRSDVWCCQAIETQRPAAAVGLQVAKEI